jgi:SMC interacting uncharacterized protein involved in chromosome segregation
MPDRATSPEAQRLRRELDESNSEVSRLRGLLIARDAELGAAKGRLAELEDQMRRLSGAARRILRVPGAFRLLSVALRGLGGRRRTGDG